MTDLYIEYAKRELARRNELATEALGLEADIESAEKAHGIDAMRGKLRSIKKELKVIGDRVLVKANEVDTATGNLFEGMEEATA